mgnify:CR=1 FL=1
MKKKIVCLLLFAMLLVSGALPVYASGIPGTGEGVGSNWQVSFTQAGEVEDNLGTAGSVNDMISTMQPGDEVTVSVKLTNENSDTTDWYMKNTITRSMEDAQATGGAYSYNLVYDDFSGTPLVLYSSESVGGDNNQGLNDVDSRIKDDYFYLGSIAGGQSGTVRLTVGLDGETQGNSYMDKVANLTMNFAVERQPQGTADGDGDTRVRTVRREVGGNQVIYVDDAAGQAAARRTVYIGDEGVPLAGNRNIVRTSDEMNLFPYVLAACISGSMLLFFALFTFAGRKKEEEEGGAAG